MPAWYDDIIVGAGAAGAVLAARLSEDSARTVLLLEAGPDFATPEETPAELLDRRRPVMQDFGWGYTSSPAPGRTMPLPRGKVIGGSSAVNGAVALRGAPEDFDEWARLGNPGWAWADVLPYFTKLEDDQDETGPYHGKGGPIPIRRSRPDELAAMHVAVAEACRALGFPAARDHNAPDSSGIGPIPLNVRGETRISTALGYLLPARQRPNLTIRANCLVDRVLFSGNRARAVAVRTGDHEEQFAGRRITLAAGAIGTPLILLRSGIGPREQLARLGINTIADRPGVGANLIDHAGFTFALIARPGTFDSEIPAFQTMLRYTAPGSAERNDLQLLPWLQAASITAPDILAHTGGADAYSFTSILQRPRSRGSVTLTSADPSAPPRIDLNLLADPEDLRRLLAGTRQAWVIAHQAPLAAIASGTAILDEATVNSDERLTATIFSLVNTSHHAAGTARMGPADDSGAVVDADGRVYGVERLRVADAAIMPTICRANTNLTTIMIGERLADTLREQDD